MTYLEWLVKGKYERLDDNSWSRETALGCPKCKETGKPRIMVAKVGELFQMSLRGYTGVFWADLAAYQLDEDCLVRRGNQIEMRLVDAWREFN